MPQLTRPTRSEYVRGRDSRSRPTDSTGRDPAYDRAGQARYRPSTRSASSRPVGATGRRVASRAATEEFTHPARRPASTTARFFQAWSIDKSFTLFALTTGVVLAVAFALDLVLGQPVNEATRLAEITLMLSGVVLVLLSLNVASDQVNGRGRFPTRFRPQRA